MASPIGIEPTTYRLGGDRSIQLSYEDIITFSYNYITFKRSWEEVKFNYFILIEKLKIEKMNKKF